MEIHAIDLFCGAGGLSYGLQMGGVNVVAGFDLDPACEYPYATNNAGKFVLQSVEDITGEQLNAYFPQNGLKLLAGCAPCQAFSTYTQAQKIHPESKWSLVKHFLRLIGEVDPDFVTMENVSNLTREGIFQQVVSTLKGLKYFVWHEIVDCLKYGVPQQRYRLVLIASKTKTIKLIAPQGGWPTTVRETISTLPPLKAGESSLEDPLHRASNLSPLNKKRIQVSIPGGTWRDWPSELVAECHKNHTGKTYPSVYGRMKWDAPAPTITTQFYGFGNGRFGHPKQDRALSLREGALLQTFPPHYQFVPSSGHITMKTIGRLIGNAVPVNLGDAIARTFVMSLK